MALFVLCPRLLAYPFTCPTQTPGLPLHLPYPDSLVALLPLHTSTCPLTPCLMHVQWTRLCWTCCLSASLILRPSLTQP